MKETVWNGKPIEAPGMYRGVPMADYHGQLTVTPSISSSGQRLIWSESAADFYDQSYLNPFPPEPKERPHFSLGRAAHHLLLLGRKGFDAEFVVRPEKYASYKTDAAKEWKAEQLAAGMTVITDAELRDIAGMARSLAAHPMVRAGILDGLVERTLVYRDAETGVWVKARPDAIPADEDFADLKTCAGIDDDSLQRSITDFAYHQQGATVRAAAREALGIEMRSFALVCVRKTRPYSVRVVEVTPEDLDRGEDQNRVANHAFARGIESGQWPGPGDQNDAEYMGLQPYMRARIDARLAVAIPEIEAQKYLRAAGQ